MIIWTNEGAGGGGGGTWTPKTLHTFDDVVWHVSWSVSGNMLAVSGGDNRVTLWKENLAGGDWVCISDLDKQKEQQQQQQSQQQQQHQQAAVQG